MRTFMAAALAACAVSAAAGEPAGTSRADMTTGTLIGDARKIITSDKGNVRLWTHAPRVLVLSTDARVADMVRTIGGIVDTTVAAGFGDGFFSRITARMIPQNWPAADAELSMRLSPGGPAGAEIEAKLGSLYDGPSDIVVAVGDRKTIALINTLWRADADGARYQAEGHPFGCFYSAHSRAGQRQAAFVSIVPPEDDKALYACLWEELLHTLGPLRDAHQTPFFSFNDRTKTWPQRENDILLIKALYESGAGAGGDPEVVLRHFEALLEASGQDVCPHGSQENAFGCLEVAQANPSWTKTLSENLGAER